MAASPAWKVYDANKKYQAACKEPEAAACLVALYGDGATVRWEHFLVVWTQETDLEGRSGHVEDADGDAGNSYDGAAKVMLDKVAAYNKAAYQKVHGPGSARR